MIDLKAGQQFDHSKLPYIFNFKKDLNSVYFPGHCGSRFLI